MRSTLARITLVFGFIVTFSACTYQRATLDKKVEEAIAADDQGKIPTAAFFAMSEYKTVKLSPTGIYVGAIFNRDGQDQLAILSRDMKTTLHIQRFADDVEVKSFEWVNEDRVVIEAGSRYGYLDGRTPDDRLYFVNCDGSDFKDFFRWSPYDYKVLSILPKDHDHITIVKRPRVKRRFPEGLLLDVYSGSATSFELPAREGPKVKYFADADGHPNIAYTDESKRGEFDVFFDNAWHTIKYPVKGPWPVTPVSYDSKKGLLTVLSARETGLNALYTLDVRTLETKTVFAHERADIIPENIYREEGRVVGAMVYNGRPEIVVLDPNSSLMKMYKKLEHDFPGELVSGVHYTRDKQAMIFRVTSDRNPGEYFTADHEGNNQLLLLKQRSGIHPEDLGPREPFTMKARDGLELNGYITLPKDKGMHDGLPMVVLPHGGPIGKEDVWKFDPEAQYFASRGYAVLQVNYRGSGGYGTKLVEAGYSQYGRAMQDDLTDATHWAIDQKTANPDRICIFGVSYGGYAALQGAVKEPDLYRCAVSFSGLSDLSIQFADADYTQNAEGQKGFLRKAGKREEFADISPALHADRIKIPIFIVHGEDDVRVPYAHALAMRQGLEKAGKPYKWLVKPSEGHGFTQPSNRIEAFHAIVRFFDESTQAPRPAPPQDHKAASR